MSVRRESTALILLIENNKRHSKGVTAKLNYNKHKGFCYFARFLLLSCVLQAIQKNNLTLMPGAGLKKKGEDEVSTDVYRIYSNDINRLLTKCEAEMTG